jgi:putative cell wall-binding protein
MEEILSKSTKGLRKAGVASIAVSLTLGAGAFGAGAANAVEGFSFDRIPGENRYDTSALIADEYNATNVHTILAPGEHGKYADALSANLLAGSTDSPILLTRKEFTPKPVLQQLRDQGTQRITVVGGAGVISDEQLDALRSEGYTVNRVSGPDRFDTNAEVIEAADVQAVNGTGLVATGFDFADALAGGPVSYQGHPLGLSTKDDIEQDVIDALKAAGVERVYILGGTAAVSNTVVVKLEANGINVAGRLAGANRAATSVEIAEFAVANWGFTNEHVGVASGYVEGSGADALAGGPLEGQGMAPILVTRNERNPGEVLDYLSDHSNTLVDGHLFGGIVAITAEAERQMTEAAQGQGRAQVTVSSQNVEAGQDITGTVAGENIDSVSVAGPCVQNGDVQDTNATTSDVEFSIPTNNDAQGSCELTFTTTFDDGTTETDTVTVNVTQPTSATVRPELRDAAIVDTNTAGELGPDGTTVRYTFDEEIVNAGGLEPVETLFHVYNEAAVQQSGTDVVDVTGRTVTVRFAGVTTDLAAAELTVATVDLGAVRDESGDTNPEGDAGLGDTTGGGTVDLQAGITEAPDLTGIGGFADVANGTQVEYTFDEAVTGANDATLFNLIQLDGTPLEGAAVVGGEGTQTLIIRFAEDITRTDIARGTVDPGAVTEETDNEGDGFDTNVLQAADVSNNGNTVVPDLVSVELREGAETGGDQALFTFDENVATADATAFQLYKVGTQTVNGTGTAQINSANPQQVLVNFNEGAIDNAVGGQVLDNAVAETTGGRTNQEDEVGVANTTTEPSRAAGRTAAPDLTGVALEARTDAFGNTEGVTATYTFDENVALIDQTDYQLYKAGGELLNPASCETGLAATPGDNTDDNTVICQFTNANDPGEALAATLGTVDDGAAIDGESNASPEGAEFTTGGTGTPTR